jgi:hypothetical protein
LFRRSAIGTGDLRSASVVINPRTSSRVRPRVNVIFSISRSRRSRANPTSAADPRGSRTELTTTSSPMKPTTTEGDACSAWSAPVASVSTLLSTSGWFGAYNSAPRIAAASRRTISSAL